MMRRTNTNSSTGVRSSPSGSTRSTPRLRASSSQNAFPVAAVNLSAVAATRPGVAPPSPSLPNAHENSVGTPLTEAKKKKKEKKELKEKKGRPQNALFSLASTFNGGEPVRANVVDLHSLDPTAPQLISKRGNGAAAEDVPATQILSFLYLGSVKDAQDPDLLAKHGIRYIINVSQEEYWSVDKRLQVFTFKVDDTATADIASLFEPTRSLINNVRERHYRSVAAGKTSHPAVLVHCQKGRSRSATIVLAYLIYTNGWSVAEAMKYVATRRPCVEPNIGFMEELRKLQGSLPSEERTKRYSELCWFMRNLDALTSEAQVQEMFELRVGFVRDVVMLTAPASGSSDAQRGTISDQERSGAASPSPSTTDNLDERDSPTKTAPLAVGDADPAETHESAHITSPIAAAGTPAPTRQRVALCFVFLACREDILRGIKQGQMRDILERLRPAPGKYIKYATGPKLRKLMTEHQSMSSSFAQDMSQFNGPLQHDEDATGDVRISNDADPANQVKQV
ncbi:putative Dual-specificity protein phosphatase [Leptomonas pyrrhocoris]|uniref:protein-tyrosine-phosphatase n=1 Tax=Leptomonas pyrrhocoris TaxID=157538 RepID=A0A0M9FRW3_LEPPY|nr:putative Dual-specificity protein phosphatase [Leptomonas pyrrhocoris]XP_015653235.1 putative Dual-specificity protein phosphatase [Leptomonas pyrrhocoris]KPA74795.1 putative Dual-specificity protein phosphatase [Leptomonas pyrrhocoris]KPA74796.1 putative Dual-specificity protein phosphatase [Leptomonas pyrrhocoris]|eukprot:XP_015653234.1 putative Dual-specificity protein phosphatase [Leptomonas pyrrhocoris]